MSQSQFHWRLVNLRSLLIPELGAQRKEETHQPHDEALSFPYHFPRCVSPLLISHCVDKLDEFGLFNAGRTRANTHIQLSALADSAIIGRVWLYIGFLSARAFGNSFGKTMSKAAKAKGERVWARRRSIEPRCARLIAFFRAAGVRGYCRLGEKSRVCEHLLSQPSAAGRVAGISSINRAGRPCVCVPACVYAEERERERESKRWNFMNHIALAARLTSRRRWQNESTL